MRGQKFTNRFGGLLDRFFIGRQWSLHQAGRLLGQNHSVLSAVVRGKEVLSRRNLEKIVDRLHKHPAKLDMTPTEAADFAIDLQIAWLEDQALPSLAERVAVIRRRAKSAPKVSDPRVLALDALDEASAGSPAIAHWIVASAGLLEQIPAHGRKYRRKAPPANSGR